MKLASALQRLGRDGVLRLGGALISLAVAAALFSRFGINGNLNRDEAIYAYGGQQFSHGVAPYDSIFDVKGPIPSMLAGVAAAIAHLIGRNDLYMIRVAYFACACLTVVAIYLLTARLWRSTVAGLVAAVVFASFNGFAEDALSGPDAKTPGILVAVVSMWLLTRRQWFWGAFFGSLALLSWQPLAIYPAVAVLAASLSSECGKRWKSTGLAVAGAAVPLLAATIYFSAVGAMGRFVEAGFVFPVTGLEQGHETVRQRVHHIVDVVRVYYKFSGGLLWAGIAALVLLAIVLVLRSRRHLGAAFRHPLINVVLLTLVVEAGFAATDFQGYPDVYPLLPYGALGLGGLTGTLVTVLNRPRVVRPVSAAALVAAMVLATFSWSWFSNDPAASGGLRHQQADGCAIERMLVPGHPLYALGDPTELVMTRQRNPDRFIYLESGVDDWKIAHTPGGFDGWTAQIQAAHPSVVAVGGWYRKTRYRMTAWLKQQGYLPGYVGRWRIFLIPAARNQARDAGVKVTHKPTAFATGPRGHELPPAGTKSCS